MQIHNKKRSFKSLNRLTDIIKDHSQLESPACASEIRKIIEDNYTKLCSLEFQNNELKQRNVFLKEECKYYHHFYLSMPFACVLLDKNGTILNINELAQNLLGIKRNHLINKNFSRYVEMNFYGVFSELFKQSLLTDQAQTCEIKLLRKDGIIFSAKLEVQSIHHNKSDDPYVLIYLNEICHHDEDQRKNNEQNNNIFLNQYLSAMDYCELVINELKHPFAIINNYLFGCIRRLESNQFQTPDIIRALKSACEQSERIIEIVLRMKNFVFKQALNNDAYDINLIINETIELILNENKSYPLDIKYYPLQQEPVIFIDRIHIQQVILNIARNSIEAMKDAGVTQPKLTIEANYLAIDLLEICITDNGPGINDDDRYKIFSPYYTTKSYGVGSGLSFCKKIVETYGGTILAEKQAQGMCVKFTLLTHPSS